MSSLGIKLYEESAERSFSSSIASTLPAEILEIIMSMLSYHRDLPNVRQVCRHWESVAVSVMGRCKSKFQNAINNGTTIWSYPIQSSLLPGPTIAGRYQHSTCYYDRAMYVFGGCTSSTTCFNDIWKFDIGSSKWCRPFAQGDYPQPKACASLVPYKDKLILFGGFTYSSHNAVQEQSKFYDHLHFFCPKNNVWSLRITSNTPSGRAGHQASIIGDKMLVFGGNCSLTKRSNDVWVLDLLTFDWTEVTIFGPKPQSRTAHTQEVLDEEHLLVVGGHGENKTCYYDVWLLVMPEGKAWYWKDLVVLELANAPLRMFGHPACVVGNKVIILGTIIKTSTKMEHSKKRKCNDCHRRQNQQQQIQQVQQQQEQQQLLRHRRSNDEAVLLPEPIHSNAVQQNAITPASRRNMQRDRERQLQILFQYEEKLRTRDNRLPVVARGNDAPGPSDQGSDDSDVNPDQNGDDPNDRRLTSRATDCVCCLNDNEKRFRNIHLLDVSRALSDGCVEWKPVTKSKRFVHDELVLYSLVNCTTEVVMFGGIEDLKDQLLFPQHAPTVSNLISFLSYQDHIF